MPTHHEPPAEADRSQKSSTNAVYTLLLCFEACIEAGLTAYSDQEVTSAEQTQLYGHGLFA